MTSCEPTVSCIGCDELSRCKLVTAHMIARDDRCDLYEPAEPGTETARLRILEDFGAAAVLADPNPRKRGTEKPMSASRPNLRKLALAAGVLERSPKVFQLKAEELIEELEEEFPDIAGLDDDDVKSLIAEIETDDDGEEPEPKKKAPAKKPTRRRTTKKAEEEEPPKKTARRRSTKKEEPEKKAPRRRRSAKKKEPEEEAPAKKTARRGRGRKAAPKEESKAPVNGADLGDLPDKVDHIGGTLDDLAKKVAGLPALKKEVAAVKKAVDEIDGKVDALTELLTELADDYFGEG